MGFGGGALIASPLSRQLLSLYDAGYDPGDARSVAVGFVANLLIRPVPQRFHEPSPEPEKVAP